MLEDDLIHPLVYGVAFHQHLAWVGAGVGLAMVFRKRGMVASLFTSCSPRDHFLRSVVMFVLTSL